MNAFGELEIIPQDQDQNRDVVQTSPATETDTQPPTGGRVSAAAPHVGAAVRLSRQQIDDLADAARVFGCELIHLGMQGSTLQLIIDHPEGVTVDHCADVSRQASAILDRDDFGASRYVLEVSSPGIERELFRAVDYARFLGHPVRITLRGGDGKKRSLDARLDALEGFEDGSENSAASDDKAILALVVESEDAPDRGEVLRIALRDVVRARLKVDL